MVYFIKETIMQHNPEPIIIEPFSLTVIEQIRAHVTQIRNCFDWPGVPYHDANAAPEGKFNRWFWHNLPLLKHLHNDPEFIAMASDLAGRNLKPTYSFLSMYGPEGVCPLHTDRPQCQFTIDLLINSNHKEKPWPIFVAEKPYVLDEKNGQALFYSGTGQAHYREPMATSSDATKVDLAFFHFAPVEWMGELN